MDPNERAQSPAPAVESATTSAETPAAETATTGFSATGAIPPVAAEPTAAPQAAPTASERAFGGIGGAFKRAGQELEVLGAEAVGVAELAGFRYSVKAYEAQVDGGLYRGSRLDDAGMASLKAQGIQGVVNLCLENDDDTARAAKLGLKSLHVPILDNSPPSIAQMMQFINFAKANPPTYVHCEAGKGRTGTAVACYRIAVDGWTADQAIDEARSFGLSLINQIDFIHRFAEAGGAEVEPAASASTPATEPAAPAPAG